MGKGQSTQSLKTTLRLLILILDYSEWFKDCTVLGGGGSFLEVALSGFACHFQPGKELSISLQSASREHDSAAQTLLFLSPLDSPSGVPAVPPPTQPSRSSDFRGKPRLGDHKTGAQSVLWYVL